jgi:predicted GIY-YIG superfamily endonuclease
LDQHLNNDGTKFTGSFKDWEISAIFEASTNIAEAMKIERFIKRQKS